MFRWWIVVLMSMMLSSTGWGQATLSGVVTTQKVPLADANVFLVERAVGTVTDASGAFQITNLPGGTYTLRVSYVGFLSREQQVRIPEKGVVRLEIELGTAAYSLDELIVSSTRAGALTPMTYQNIQREEIAVNNLGQDLPYLLQMTPSAVVTSDAGAGIGYTGIRIRGTDATRINVTINGIPLNDAESQGVFWVNMPDFASSVSSLQIQRGVGTSTNGAGAFGATINLNTAQVEPEAYALLGGSAGSFNTWKRNVRFGTGLLANKFTIDGRLSQISSDGYIDRAQSDLKAYYLSGAYVGDRSLVRFNVFSGKEITYQAWNGVPADLVDDWDTRTFNSAGTERPGEPHPDEVDNYQQTHYQLLYNQQLGQGWNLNLAGHYTQGAGYFEQYRADQDFADYGLVPLFRNDSLLTTDIVRRRWLDNDFYGLVYGLQFQQDKLDFTLGGGFHQYRGAHFGEITWAEYASNSLPGDRYYDNEARKVDFNIYSKWNYQLHPNWNVFADLQLRRVSYNFVGVDEQANSVAQQDELVFFNPKVGIFWAPATNHDLYASLAVANREPNRDDYTENPPANRPRPERLYDTEVGYRWRSARATAEFTGYYMYYRDQLALNGQINDVGAYTRINIDRSYRLGMELAGGWQVTPGLNLQANLALSRNKVVAFSEFLDRYETLPNGAVEWTGQQEIKHQQTDLAYSPAFVAGAEISWEPFRQAKWLTGQSLELAWLSKYVSRQYLDNTQSDPNVIQPFGVNDIRMRYQGKKILQGEVTLTLLLQNVFNAMYENNGWAYRYVYDGGVYSDRGYYPQAGRNFLLGVEWRF